MLGQSAVLFSPIATRHGALTLKVLLRQPPATQACRCVNMQAGNAVKFNASHSRLIQSGLEPFSSQLLLGLAKMFKPCSHNLSNWTSGLKHHIQQRRHFTTSDYFKAITPKPFNMSGGSKGLKHDTLVYSHKNDAFYKTLSYFGIFQLGMWAYLSLFAFQQLKTVPVGVEDTSSLPWYQRFLYKQGQYKNALSLLSLAVGGLVFFITATYPRRVVKSLWLLRGGQTVKVTTYSWMGKNRTFTKPVEHLSCMEARTGTGHNIPMKIKDNNFYYIIDKQGTFPKTDLFDYVIGVKRKL